MSYCAVADVQADFKAVTFTGSSLVTSTAVTQFIVEAGALIDSYVGKRWVTPITADASSLALMSLFCRTLVADRIRGILENKQQANTSANQQVKADSYTAKDVMAALKLIQNGEIQLSGATLVLAHAAFYSNNQSNNRSPTFKKDTKQW